MGAMLAVLTFQLWPLASGEEWSVPQRVRFANSGGTVVFEHMVHAEKYDISCEQCHHENPLPRIDAKKCRDCHGKTLDATFIAGHVSFYNDNASCATCHHVELGPTSWNHEVHAKEALKNNCVACHHKDPVVEPKPQNCANCHAHGLNDSKTKIWLPLLGNAAHERCMPCHQESFASAAGCIHCHKERTVRDVLPEKGLFEPHNDFRGCVICHDKPAEKLILPPMEAFHKKCMGCHQKLERGPFTKADCGKCHTK